MVAYGVQVSSLHWEERNRQRFCVLFVHQNYSSKHEIQLCFSTSTSTQIPCNYLGLPLFLLKDICVLNYKNYNENWAPNHCEKMLIWFLCINFALAKIRKGVQKLASFVRPFFMSVPKAQPLRFNTFLRLEQNPRSSSGNHHQWCRALNLCYHILVIFFQSFSWPQFIALIYMKATCRDSWAPHRPHWYVEWWG